MGNLLLSRDPVGGWHIIRAPSSARSAGEIFLEVPQEPVVDLADQADHGQVAGAVADISLSAGDAGGQSLAALYRNHPVLTAMPDLDGHPKAVR